MRLWPTVTVTGNHNRKGASAESGDGLSTAAKNWPTPMASDANGPGHGAERQGGPNLRTAVQAGGRWSTPKARDWRSGKGASGLDCNAPDLNVQVTMAGEGALNPEWTEALMGFPVGWTEVSLPVPVKSPARGSRRGRRAKPKTAPPG